ncbi:WD repeat-containing protein 6 [Didymella sp. IMI 355093]|nr:WD repeat-containing protein 6 [Didymella sp. IMI 355093]
MDAQRTRHTGFSVAAADEKPETSNCLAIGWGHTSRVWRIRFLDSSPCDGALGLLSAGEDATSRTWKLVASKSKGSDLGTLQQTDCSAYHNGKNMWSIAAYRQHANLVRVACGAADGKLMTHRLVGTSQRSDDQGTSVAEYTLQDVLHMAEPSGTARDATSFAKASKKGDSIRSYCFVSKKTFLLITNSGKVLIESFRPHSHPMLSSSLTSSTLVGQLDDLLGYSTCTGNATHEIAFLAGTKGSIYMYSAHDSSLRNIHTVTGKVGALFVTDVQTSEGRKRLALLITLVGQKCSQLLIVDISSSEDPEVVVIEKVHGDETVTGMMIRALPESASIWHLYSVGRDGCLAVHSIDVARNIVTLLHNSILPIGPNIEDLFIWQDRLLVHGFSSKKWVLYDITAEEEVMGIETGGAHRSWAFQPHPSSDTPGGTLIATGAEDTDIKIFTYDTGELICRRTLRKHTTGIQHLQWSENGEYLFSSAGSEEFYIWRVRSLHTDIDVGIVCEYVYAPESEFSDLRIMSFDCVRQGGSYIITMVFSDSSIKTYRYNLSLAPQWQPLARGIYSTSCLTQTFFLSPTLLIAAGTDGHAVFWPLPSSATSAPLSTGIATLAWKQPLLIHQNNSQTMDKYSTALGTLLVSGGDDGALAFVLVKRDPGSTSTCTPTGEAEQGDINAGVPVLVSRAHASAVTACAILSVPRAGSDAERDEQRLFVLTSGNDEWVRLWSVQVNGADEGDTVTVKRLERCKTSVADVSSMAVLGYDGRDARVVVCGVGMEVIKVDFGGESDVVA